MGIFGTLRVFQDFGLNKKAEKTKKMYEFPDSDKAIYIYQPIYMYEKN